MEQTESIGKRWKSVYTWLLIANMVYIVFFYFLMQHYS